MNQIFLFALYMSLLSSGSVCIMAADSFYDLLSGPEQLSSSSSLYKDLNRKDLEALGFEYSDYVRYLTPREKYMLPFKDLHVTDRGNTEKFSDPIAKHSQIKWSVRFINDEIGYGTFAQEDVAIGTMIGEYTGIMVSGQLVYLILDANYMWNIQAFSEYYPGKILYVDAKKVCNFTRFINHSDNPNVAPINVYAQEEWHIIYVACKSIKKGEQLLVDYGAGYWRGKAKPVDL